VAFADGDALVVLPNEQYEAFAVAGSLPHFPGGFTSWPSPGLAPKRTLC
jgi:hypothetical protein